MHRVAKWIEDRRYFLIDRRIVAPDIGHWQGDEFREGSRPVDPHALGMRAQVPPPGQTVSTPSTNHMALTAYDVAGEEVVDVRSHGYNFANKLMANRHRYGNCLLRPLVPLVNVHIRATDTGIADAHHY